MEKVKSVKKVKDLYQFMKNKNKISYTFKKAYDLGFSNSSSDVDDNKNPLSMIQKMKFAISNTYMRNKLAYADVNIDFMNIIPYLNNIERMNEIISSITIQYLRNNVFMEDMMEDYLIEQMQVKKIIFINLCIYNYNTERCTEEEAVHGTSIIFIPIKDKYHLYYINSHGYDMKDSMEFHIIKTKSRCKVFKYNNVLDFIFLERFTNYFNMNYGSNKLIYKKDKVHNYWGANFQGGDNHGICFVFPYIIFYNLCKYYTQKKALLDGSSLDTFKNLMLNGNINTMIHTCFVDFMDNIDDIYNTDAIDDMVVKLDYRFIKKISNCFIAYISQSYFT
jgi:hypothetical protein